MNYQNFKFIFVQSKKKPSLKLLLLSFICSLTIFIAKDSFAGPVSVINKKKNSQIIPLDDSDKTTTKKFVTQLVHKKSSAIDKKEETTRPVLTDPTNNIIKEFLNSKKMGIIDLTNSFDVLTTTTFKGKLLNSIKSTNLLSPIKVMFTSNSDQIPFGAILSCAGVTTDTSVTTHCNKLIVNDEEYEVQVDLLNLDGTSGLRGEVYTGLEEGILGSLAAAYLRSSLDIQQDRVPTFTGEMVKNTAKNKVLSGQIGALDEGVEILNNQMKGKQTKIVIDAGTEVIIYFQSRFKI